MAVSATNYDSHSSVGMFVPSVGAIDVVANSGNLSTITIGKATMTSITTLRYINLKTTAIEVATGNGNYAISGILSTDKIIDAFGCYWSNATTTSDGIVNPTVTISNRTGSVGITGSVSTGVVFVTWADIST